MSSIEEIKVRRSRGGERDECVVEMLTLKITAPSSSMRGGGSKLLLELVSDSDLLFYFSVTFTESDFHVLKSEQRLLVDFFQFPEMIRQLCKLGNATIAFAQQDSDGILSITETSQFREITHLSLKFRKGSDEAVKAVLATRLGHYKSTSSDLESRVQELTIENRKMCSDRELCVSELTKLRIDTDTAVSAIQATCRAQLAELREDHAREIRDLHLSTSNEYTSESRRLLEELREKDGRNRELERRLDETRMMLISTENDVKSSHARISTLEQQLERRDLDTRDFSQRIKHYEDRISNLSSELVGLRNASTMVSPEVQVKDDTINKLQMKNKELKRILKDTQNALLEQEKVVERQARELDEARARMTESTGLALEMKKLQEKLSDSQQIIDNNSRIITYLNQQGRSLGLPSPLSTPSLLVDPAVPDYPNRSTSFIGRTDVSPTVSSNRVFRGPVKFTARIDSKEPPLLK